MQPLALSLRPQAVTALVKNFPKHMVSSMQQILPIVWNTLTDSAALYPFPELGVPPSDEALAASAFPVSFSLPRRLFVKQTPSSISLLFVILT